MHLGSLLDWPFLYNVADAYVCIGMAILLLQSFFSGKKRQTVAADTATPTTTPSSGTTYESPTE
jgi:hypothetical protein